MNENNGEATETAEPEPEVRGRSGLTKPEFMAFLEQHHCHPFDKARVDELEARGHHPWEARRIAVAEREEAAGKVVDWDDVYC